jgi:hypothetical protein
MGLRAMEALQIKDIWNNLNGMYCRSEKKLLDYPQLTLVANYEKRSLHTLPTY